MIAPLVYFFCGLSALVCAGLLIRNYRRTPSRFLLFSSACFGGLALNNVLLFVDLVVVPEVDVTFYRATLPLVSGLILIWGFIWEAE